MRIISDNQVVYLEDSIIEALKEFVIAVMDIKREKDPEYAYCWNYCLIQFKDINPTFCYGGIVDDVISYEAMESCILVPHPKIIDEVKRKNDKK